MKRPTNTSKSFLSQRTWEQYQKLLQRLQKSLDVGRFQQLSQTRRETLLSTLRRYYNRLLKGNYPLRKLAIGGAFLFSLTSSFSLNGQVYVQPGGAGNPLGTVNVGSLSFPVFVDMCASCRASGKLSNLKPRNHRINKGKHLTGT